MAQYHLVKAALLIYILSFQVSALLYALDGGGCGDNSCIIAVRNPFISGLYGCDVSYSVISPVDAGVYYSNNVDINLSVASGDECYYRVIQDEVTYGWNVIVCGNNTKTLPDGDMTIEIRVIKGNCLISESIDISVMAARPGLGSGFRMATWIPFLFLGAVIFLKKRRKKALDVVKNE